MAATEMSLTEIIVFVVVAMSVITVPFILVYLNSRITVNINDNDAKRATYETVEVLLSGELAKDGGFLLDKLNTLDGTPTEPVYGCYAYRATVSSPTKIQDKNTWMFGYGGSAENAFSADFPVYIVADRNYPANFRLDIYDTKNERCGTKK